MTFAEAPVRDGYWTPDHIFEYAAEKWGPFDLDAAASPNNTKCSRFYTEEDNGLNQPWDGVVWCNPPYRKLINWVMKADQEVNAGRAKRVVMLLPAHTSTAWFHYAMNFGKVEFILGKIKFGGAKGVPLWGSVWVVFEEAS